MKKQLFIISILTSLCVIYIAIGQVVLDQSSVTKIKRRDLSDVQIIYHLDNTITIRGTIGVTTLSDNEVIQQRSLATIELSDTNLTTALAAANLPTANIVRDRFRTLFHSAWTNKIGIINLQGEE